MVTLYMVLVFSFRYRLDLIFSLTIIPQFRLPNCALSPTYHYERDPSSDSRPRL